MWPTECGMRTGWAQALGGAQPGPVDSPVQTQGGQFPLGTFPHIGVPPERLLEEARGLVRPERSLPAFERFSEESETRS